MHRALAPALLLLCACAPPEETARGDYADLLDWAEARRVEWQVPGVAIVLLEGGETTLITGLGQAQVGRPERITADTLFRVGSLSKLFTGALALQEAAAGRLDLYGPAAAALPGLALHDPEALDRLSLFQLLSHQSGLQTTGMPTACDPDPAALASELAARAPTWDLWTEPGQLYNYANNGFALAGLAVEQAAGAPFPALAAARLFGPAGMATATYDPDVASALPHATGHAIDRDSGVPFAWYDLYSRACGAIAPSGGLIASARDLSALAELLLRGGAPWLTPEQFAVMTDTGWPFSDSASYGYGLLSTTYRGHRALSHTGAIWGYLALIEVLPDDGVGVVVLMNSDHNVTLIPEPRSSPTGRLAYRALDTLLGLEEATFSSTVRPEEEWDRYPGYYRSDFSWGRIQVSQEDDGLWIHFLDQDTAAPLLPYSEDSFQYAYRGAGDRDWYQAVDFLDDGSGERTGWLISRAGVAARLAATVSASPEVP